MQYDARLDQAKHIEGACQPGTRNCICETLSRLYKSGNLKLFRGRVSSARLAEALGSHITRFQRATRHRPDTAPGRCIRNFDSVLESFGHGTVWTEKIPTIRETLDELARTGALPVNAQGDLNRQAILRPSGLRKGTSHNPQSRTPELKNLLDEYDTTRDDPRYSPYKYDALNDRLKALLADPHVKLTNRRKINLTQLANHLGVNSRAIKSTPKLKRQIDAKQRELDKGQRRGTTANSFRIGGIEHINLGATPYSNAHHRIFDFTDLVPAYGLEFAEKVGTLFIVVTATKRTAKASHARLRRFLLWLSKKDPAITAHLKSGTRIARAQFERVCQLYQHKLASKKRTQSPALRVIEELANAGLFPPCAAAQK